MCNTRFDLDDSSWPDCRMRFLCFLLPAFFVLLFPQATAAQQHEFVYIANSTSDNISAYKLATASGSLTQVIGSPFKSGHSGPTSIAVDQSKRYLYAANQFAGDDDVRGFRIEGTTGRLLPIPGSPFKAG